MNTLEGKTAIVTGAAGNLGAAVARVFASQGIHLALVDLNEDGLAITRDAVATQTEVKIYPTNLIDPESVATSFSSCPAFSLSVLRVPRRRGDDGGC